MSKTVFTGKTVQVEGLDSLVRWLKDSDKKMLRGLRKGMKEAMSPVLEVARVNARFIQDDGTYAESLSIGSRSNGAQYVLKSIDAAAGVKEFAKPGALRLIGPSSKSSTQRARFRAGMPLSPGIRAVKVGVPHRAHPPRVMIPAVENSADEVLDRVDKCLEEILKEVEHG